MRAKNPITLDQVRLTMASESGDGMHVEISAPPEVQNGSLCAPFLTFRAEREGIIQVILHLSGVDVAFPLSELMRSIACAEEEVHPESYYP